MGNFMTVLNIDRKKEEYFSRIKYLSYTPILVKLFWDVKENYFLFFLNAVAVIKSNSLDKNDLIYASRCYDKIINNLYGNISFLYMVKANLALCLWGINGKDNLLKAHKLMKEYFDYKGKLNINNIDEGTILSNYALILRDLDEDKYLAEAKENMEIALNTAKRENIETSISLFKANLATILNKIDKDNYKEQAIVLLKEAILTNIPILGESSLRVTRDRITLGRLYYSLGKLENSIINYKLALQSASKMSSNDLLKTYIMMALSDVLIDAGHMLESYTQ